jgi:hypothetical protein
MTAQRVLILMGLLVAATASNGADWPQWRGPERTGISSESGLLGEWPAGGPPLLWQRNDIGDGYATPSVAGERIYVIGNRGMDNEYVQALSVADGKTVWSTRLGKVGNPDQQPPYPMARSTPTVEGAVLYALSSDGDLACVETATGKVVWQKNLRSEFGGVPGKWAYAESPLIDGDVLVVTPGGSHAQQENRRADLEIGRARRRPGGVRIGDRDRSRRTQAVRAIPRQGRRRRGCQDRRIPLAL